jgi:hypothetical protein
MMIFHNVRQGKQHDHTTCQVVWLQRPGLILHHFPAGLVQWFPSTGISAHSRGSVALGKATPDHK